MGGYFLFKERERAKQEAIAKLKPVQRFRQGIRGRGGLDGCQCRHLTANLVAQTTTFTRNIAQAQKAVEAFNKRMESIQKGLNNVSKLGKAGSPLLA